VRGRLRNLISEECHEPRRATGAYCRSMASNYNHVPRPPVVAVRDGAARVLLRRETIDDLLGLDAG
jgi:diaminopimelate decarboxylase